MDQDRIRNVVELVSRIDESLNANPNSWRDHLSVIRQTTATLELIDTIQGQGRQEWQIKIIDVFQRVAYADADGGGIPDVGNWCLRQALALLQYCPQDIELLALIGKNWLLRAQKPLAQIYLSEKSSSSSSGGSSGHAPTSSDEARQAAGAAVEAEDRLHTANYVEARGILLPAIEYLKRAVDAAQAQGVLSGYLLASAAEAYMSVGNVSSARINEQYFREAIRYLQMAAEIPNYTLPSHLQQYLEEYGPLEAMH